MHIGEKVFAKRQTGDIREGIVVRLDSRVWVDFSNGTVTRPEAFDPKEVSSNREYFTTSPSIKGLKVQRIVKILKAEKSYDPAEVQAAKDGAVYVLQKLLDHRQKIEGTHLWTYWLEDILNGIGIEL